MLVIEALPVLDADGVPVLQEDGTPLYELRNLHLSAELLERLEREGYAYVLFRVGEAVMLIQLDTLDNVNHIFTLEPVHKGEETAAESQALSEVELLTMPYRAYARVNGQMVELAEIAFQAGVIEESVETALDEKAQFLFCEEYEQTAFGPVQLSYASEGAKEEADWMLYLTSPLENEGEHTLFALVLPHDAD